MPRTISAKIVADSINAQGNRITTYVLTYPRIIHAEVMTHRMFSRNAASSRAIPFLRMVDLVQNDPFIPIAWQKDHKGMQGIEYETDPLKTFKRANVWVKASQKVVESALYLSELGVTKQICNRLLEPFVWYTSLVTATEYDNFFELRCPKYKFGDKIYHSKRDWYLDPELNLSNGFIGDAFPHETEEWWYSINESSAEIHIQALAEAMWDALNESTPKLLQPGEWHIPFGDQMDLTTKHPVVIQAANELIIQETNDFSSTIPTIDYSKLIEKLKVQIAVARCARLSYMTFDGEIDYEKDLKLFHTLLKNKHMSPFEHVAKCMSELQYYSFIKGMYPSTEDQWGILNYEYYPVVKKAMFEDDKVGENSHNENRYGWCNNFRGFIQYRFFLENK